MHQACDSFISSNRALRIEARGKKEASSVVEYALPSRGMKAIEKKSLLFVESKSSIVV